MVLWMLVCRFPGPLWRTCRGRWWRGRYHTGIETSAAKSLSCVVLSRRCGIEYHFAVV